jgi:hypothetical protein
MFSGYEHFDKRKTVTEEDKKTLQRKNKQTVKPISSGKI